MKFEDVNPYAPMIESRMVLETNLPAIINRLQTVVESGGCSIKRFYQELLEVGAEHHLWFSQQADPVLLSAHRLTTAFRRWVPIDARLGMHVEGLKDDYILSPLASPSDSIIDDLKVLQEIRHEFLTKLSMSEGTISPDGIRSLIYKTVLPGIDLSSHRESIIINRFMHQSAITEAHPFRHDRLRFPQIEAENMGISVAWQPQIIGGVDIETIHKSLQRIATSMNSCFVSRCRRALNRLLAL